MSRINKLAKISDNGTNIMCVQYTVTYTVYHSADKYVFVEAVRCEFIRVCH